MNKTDEEFLDEINFLIKSREECRKKKEWKMADEIRNFIFELGIILEDTSFGTIRRLRCQK